MARIRIEELGQGQHPSEVMISVATKDGRETLIVDRRSIKDHTIDVGYPVGSDGEHLLVELPRETMRGLWRVLISRAILSEDVHA